MSASPEDATSTATVPPSPPQPQQPPEPRHALYWDVLSDCAYPYATSLAFDPYYDILWAAGGGVNEWSSHATTVRAHTFIDDRSGKDNQPVALRFSEYCCFKCTQSASANARVAIGFAGDAARPLVTFTSQIGSTVTTVGGCPLYSFNVNAQITRKVVASMTEPDAILCSGGEVPGLMRIKLEDTKRQVSVPIGLPRSLETMTAVNTHVTALPLRHREDVSWLPVGLSGGHVVIIDKNNFSHVAATPKLFHKVHTLRCHGNIIVASYGIGNTTVKMFDIRKIGETVEPLNQVTVEGNLVDLDVFESPYVGGVEMLLLTNYYFYVLNTECPEATNRSQKAEALLMASAVSRSGKLTAISMTKDNNGHIVPMRRCGNTREELPVHLGDADHFRHPPKPEPNLSRQFTTQYTDPISSGFEPEKSSGALFSDWPPDNYMIQKVQGKLKQFPPGTWPLRRCDAYRPDPTDRFNSILPNPYPFNLKVGKDPSRVSEILIPKLKELREQQRNGAVNSSRRQGMQFGMGNSYDIINRSFYPLEDATQKCFPLGSVPFDWNHWNNSLSNTQTRHVIGTDNSFPECWISPVIQSLYLIHSKHGNSNNNNSGCANTGIDLFDYPIRQLLSRHFCQRIDCVACELAIVFANMCTASADPAMPAIVQLSPLLTVLRNRAEFKDAKVFEPAKDREGMLRNMQLFQRLLLEVLHADFYTMRQEDELPNLPMPDGSNTRIASLFGGTLCGPNDTTMLPNSVVWEIPAMANSLSDGLIHLLRQTRRMSLPQVFVLLLDPSQQQSVTPEISFSTFKYKLQSCVYHVSEDNDDPGFFVTTVPNPGCPPRAFLIHDYSVADIPLREFTDADNNNNSNNAVAFEALVPRHLNHTIVAAYYVADNFTATFRYDEQGVGKDPLASTRFLLNAFPFAASQMIRDTLSHRLPQRQPPTESRRRKQHPNNNNNNNNSSSVARMVTAPEPLTAADDISPSSLSGEPFTIAPVDSGFDPVIGPSHTINNNNNNNTSHNTSRNYSNSNSNSITPPLHPVPSPPLAPDCCAYDLPTGDLGPRNFQTMVLDIGDIKSTDLVALDAEYVVPCWGNTSSRNTAKKNFLLARVSCLLSSRAGDERLLFDDYLWTREPIQDYVSTFSGIHDGDLDPERSPYRLTTMKAVYLKLRALVDRGVRFVGHGLQQDFRVCNIQVPPRQVLDTLELYYKATGGRRSTLKHLAQAVLELSVQEGEHDSVEDARASLRLYYKHEELARQGTLEQVLDTALGAWASPSSLRTPMTLPSAATDASNRSTQSQSSRGTTPSTLPNPNHSSTTTTNVRSAFGGSAVTTPSQVPAPVEAVQAFPSVPPAA